MIAATGGLQAALTDAVARVGPYLRAYRAYVEAPAGIEVVAAVELAKREPMRAYAARAVKEWSDHPLDEDPRAAVSRLVRRYAGSLITAALVPLAHGVGLDVSPERVGIVMHNDLPQGSLLRVDEVLVCAERPTAWAVNGRDVRTVDALREQVLGTLFRHFTWL